MEVTQGLIDGGVSMLIVVVLVVDLNRDCIICLLDDETRSDVFNVLIFT